MYRDKIFKYTFWTPLLIGKFTTLCVRNEIVLFFARICLSGSVQVMVHPPAALPDVSFGYKVHAVRDRITRISVSVAQVKADESLRRLSTRNGQCFMYKVVSSSFYQSNDEDTCYIKCRLKSIYNMCNCTQYFYNMYKGVQCRALAR